MKLNLLLEKMGWLTTVSGAYKTWKNDPFPYYLVLGHYINHKEHALLAAINLNYVYSRFGENGIKIMKAYLPQIARFTEQETKADQPRQLHGKDGRYWTARGINDPIMQYIMINFYRSPNEENFSSVQRGRMYFDTPEKPKPKEAPKQIGIEEFKEKSAGEIAEMVEQHQAETGIPEPEIEAPEKAPEKPEPEMIPPPEEPTVPPQTPLPEIPTLPGMEPEKPLEKPPQKPSPLPKGPSALPKPVEKPEKPAAGPFRKRLDTALKDVGAEIGAGKQAPQTVKTKEQASKKATDAINRSKKGPAGKPIEIPPEDVEIE
jgi:hypothetical protein